MDYTKIANLPTMSGGHMTKDTPAWLYCPECGLELEITENKDANEVVFQRVRVCKSCHTIDFGDGEMVKGGI